MTEEVDPIIIDLVRRVTPILIRGLQYDLVGHPDRKVAQKIWDDNPIYKEYGISRPEDW